MIAPTPGRIVWYYPNTLGRWQGPLAAIIAYVHNERLLNLGVFDPVGRVEARCHVRLLQDDDPVPEHGGSSYATWMPYQKGQAAKTEQLLDQRGSR